MTKSKKKNSAREERMLVYYTAKKVCKAHKLGLISDAQLSAIYQDYSSRGGMEKCEFDRAWSYYNRTPRKRI